MMIAAIYARKSTDQAGVADDQKSVARQVENARAYATRKGWTVDDAHVYVDDGVSGAEFDRRKGLKRLRAALVPRPRFQILIVSEQKSLGREQFGVGGLIRELAQAGVEVFAYLEDQSLTPRRALDKVMFGLRAYGDEVHREQTTARVRETMRRKAESGHVTGGSVFGYRNRDVTRGVDQHGRPLRSHVEREIDLEQADVVRRIFRLSAEGHGVKAIAKQLNADGVPAPRAQQGRPRAWAPTSVWSVLRRPLYRGELVYNRTRKRDDNGERHQTARSPEEWIRTPAPHLRIVDEALWAAAQARLSTAREVYMRATGGQRFGRPMLGNPAKHLLTNLATCGCCGGSLRARSRQHGSARKFFYGCASYHERGPALCGNKADAPMDEADALVLEALLDDVVDETIVCDAVDEALELLRGDEGAEAHRDRAAAALEAVERERAQIVAAIASGRQVAGILEALQALDERRRQLEADRADDRAPARLTASDAKRVRAELLDLSRSWRRVLIDDPTNARPIVSSLLKKRVTILPTTPGEWTLSGEGTLIGLFERTLSGYPEVIRPQREMDAPGMLNPAGIPFTRRLRRTA